MRVPPAPSQNPQEPMTRRSWLSWVGNASVLMLTPDLVGGCGDRIDHDEGSTLGSGGKGPLSSQTKGDGGSSNATSQLDPKGGASSGGSVGAASVAAAGSGNAGFDRFTPSAAEGSLYTSWKGNTVDPQDLTNILASWSLRVEGLVRDPLQLTFADLIRLKHQDQVTDFHCVEGWSVLDVPWNGVHIDRLLEFARPTSDASHVTFGCVGDVYRESIPLSVAREARTLLAYGIGGNTLPLTHGFPLRLVVPRLLAYKNAKWVNRIVLTDAPEMGYWEQRGYGYDAEVPAARLREGKY